MTIQALRDWLLNDALPLWAEKGVDRAQGGFYERLNRDLSPYEEPRRARLVSRQIYCFAAGYDMGWDGAAEELIAHGLDFLTTRLLKDDGTVIMAVSIDGSLTKTDYDPYDYAFVLFALAAAAKSLGTRDELLALAQNVRDRLIANWKHPVIGFTEALPLKSNPHMHLLEAFLAWAELVGDDDPKWQALADEMVELARTKFVLADSGALTEFFDADWQPQPDAKGLVVEPGHQLEWAWLLMRWAQIKGDQTAFDLAWRLVEIAETYGINAHKVAFNALDAQFAVRDAEAKLWPQTERLKALHTLTFHPMASPAQKAFAEARMPMAIAGLQTYFLKETPGLWHEVMGADGTLDDQPTRASSLYHITCAIATLCLTGPHA
jgi:mannose-6-phosphate isomerase